MILISGPDVMLDGELKAARSRGNKVRFWHIITISECLLSGVKRTLLHAAKHVG
jgi:hypothetical protein